MTGLLSSLFGTAAAHSVLTIGTVSVLLAWWLGVVLLTLRERRASSTASAVEQSRPQQVGALAPVIDQDLRAV